MKRLFLALTLVPALAVGQTRIASDFEIEQMERQVTHSRDFLAQISGRLNLGDLRASRNEATSARAEYVRARDAGQVERLEARRRSDLAAYATATMYTALAHAKLAETAHSFELLEEAVRYASDDAKTWNLYASAMSVLGFSTKAAAAARTAIVIADAEAAKSPTIAHQLDAAIYRYTLASALLASGDTSEADQLLTTVIETLKSKDFDALRREVARRESFEIYSSARGEESAYLSLLTRSQLRLAGLYETRGDTARAITIYRNVLVTRSDEPAALGALARLARTAEERERYFAEAFDANPFSLSLIREYRRHLGTSAVGPGTEDSTGARVRHVLKQMASREHRGARASLDALLVRFPANDTLNYLAAQNDLALGDLARAKQRRIVTRELRREVDALLSSSQSAVPAFLGTRRTTASPTAPELRQMVALLANDRLSPEQRVALDRVTLTNIVRLDAPATAAPAGQTIFEGGNIDDVAFRFGEPTAFAGTFAAAQPLRLTYRLLGATTHKGQEALLIEPLRLEGTK